MGFIAFLKFTLICIELLAWPVVGLVYPLFASVRAIESNSKYHLRKLVIYWTIFSLISLFEFAFVKIIEWMPFWSSIRLVVIFWLVMPAFDGANIAYQSFVRRWLLDLLLNLQQVSNRFNKPNKEKLHNTETFLDVADKYIKENGYEALEKLISIKRDCQVADNSQRDILVLESARELKESDAPQKCDEVEEATEKHASTETKQVQNGKEAAAAEIKNVTPPPPPQEIRQEWACILCEVKTTNETTLNAHLQGKKHKSMLESLKRNQGQKEANKKKAGEGSRKKTEERAEKKVEIWCNVCKVKFPSEIHKAAHMKGKRHSAKLAAGISSL